MVRTNRSKRRAAVVTLAAFLLGTPLPHLPGLVAGALAEAPPLGPNQIGYEVTIESITPYRTRNRTDADNVPDRDFMSFTLVGIDAAKPLDQVPPPAESYHRFWGSASDPLPATIPNDPPPVIMAPPYIYEGGGRRNHNHP